MNWFHYNLPYVAIFCQALENTIWLMWFLKADTNTDISNAIYLKAVFSVFKSYDECKGNKYKQ